MEIREVEICVIGGGPAGVSAAIKLSQLNKQVLLLDRHHFPRDKVCGDAISTFAVSCLRELDSDLLEKLKVSPASHRINGMRIYGPRMKMLEVNFARRSTRFDAHFCLVNKRLDFDNELFRHVQALPGVETMEGIRVSRLERNNGRITIHSPELPYLISSKVIIVADGSESHLKKFLIPEEEGLEHEAFSLRQYFRNVPFEGSFLEFYFVKNVLPGYVWIFPAGDNIANAGIYLQRKYIKGRKLNMRRLFNEIISQDSELGLRFKNAVPVSEIKGFNLKTGPAAGRISGDNFVLVGDAANLADPFTGEGIGNAVFSGVKAAEIIGKCSAVGSYDAAALSEYDKVVKRKLSSKMSANSGLVKLFNYPAVPQFIELLCQSKFMAGIAGYTDIIRGKLNI